MASKAYYIDWRPVSSLPSNPTRCCSAITRRPHFGSATGKILDPHEEKVLVEAVEKLAYRWRDDGIILFEFEIEDEFQNKVGEYFEAKHIHDADFEGWLREHGDKFDAIDAVARDAVSNTFSARNKEEFLRAIYAKASIKAANYIKVSTGHTHAFHSKALPRSGTAFAKADGMLRIRPIEVEFAPDEFYRSLGLSQSNSDFPFLDLLQSDTALLKLSEKSHHKDAKGVRRPAVLALRKAFARMIDTCLKTLPLLRDLHLLGTLPFFSQVRWPFTLFAYGLLAFAAGAMAYAVLETVQPQWLNKRQWIGLSFAALVLLLLTYSAIEFGVRRRTILRTLHQTAGVLQFGTVLSRVVGRIVEVGNGTAGGAVPRTEPADLGDAVAIIQRRIDMERDKRDLNREVYALFFAILAALFAIVQAFGGFAPSRAATPIQCETP